MEMVTFLFLVLQIVPRREFKMKYQEVQCKNQW